MHIGYNKVVSPLAAAPAVYGGYGQSYAHGNIKIDRFLFIIYHWNLHRLNYTNISLGYSKVVSPLSTVVSHGYGGYGGYGAPALGNIMFNKSN